MFEKFRKEEHTRENFEKAEDNLEYTERSLRNTSRPHVSDEPVIRDFHMDQYHDAIVTERKARKKLERLKKSGHKEALKLNEEYDRLRGNATQALEALDTFEKEKLGMNGEEENGVDEQLDSKT